VGKWNIQNSKIGSRKEATNLWITNIAEEIANRTHAVMRQDSDSDKENMDITSEYP